mgnify:CR=1 FL=1
MNRIKNSFEILYSEEAKGYTMVFFAGILWGTIGLFSKSLSEMGASASFIGFIRLFIGSLILLPIIFRMGGLKMFKIDKESIRHCLLLGVFSQALFNYCYNTAIAQVGVATAAVLLYTSPIFVFIMSVIFFKEAIAKRKIIALILNIFGCFLVVTGGNISSLNISFMGVFLGVAAGFLYSLVTIIGKIASGRVHPFVIVFYSFLFGWMTLGIIVRPWEQIALYSSPEFWAYSFGFGLIPTVGSYLLYMGGLSKVTEISRVPVIASVETVAATLIGVFIFKENLGIVNSLGIVVLILSIRVMNSRDKLSDLVSEGI